MSESAINPHPRWPAGFQLGRSELADFLMFVAFQAAAAHWTGETTSPRFTTALDDPTCNPSLLKAIVQHLRNVCASEGGDQKALDVMQKELGLGQRLLVDYDAYLERRLI